MEITQLIRNHVPEIGLAGVVALWLFQLYVTNRRAEQSHQANKIPQEQSNELIYSLMARVSKLELKVQELSDENTELKRENDRLRTRLIIMESAHQDAPIPMWLKDTSGKMLALNKAYEQEFLFPFGKTENDYVGNYDRDVWPGDVAREFATNDAVVASSREMWIGTETIPQADGSTKQYAIMKYPRSEGKYLIGIAGLAIPHEFMERVRNDLGD